MHCARCAHEAREGDHFCAACGAQLPPALAAALPAAEAGSDPTAAPASVPEPAAFAAPAPEPPREPLVWTPPVAPVEPPPAYAGFWRRCVATWVDALVLFFPQAILRVLMGLPVLSYDDEWGDRTVIVAESLGVLVTFLYAAVLECSSAQGSLGQQLLGLRVTDTHGRRIGFGRALARQFAKIVSMLLCGLGYLLQLWNGKRQTLHDMICGVLVVRAEEAGATGTNGVAVPS